MPRQKLGGLTLRLSMGAGFQRKLLQLAVAFLWTPGIAIAQTPIANLLPNAPAPVPEKPRGLAESSRNDTRPTLSPLSVGLSARQKYALALRRIVSPQTPLKAGFVSGWELATRTGPDLPTNGWGPFAGRFGYNAACISTTMFFDSAFVPAIVHEDPRYFPMGTGSVKWRVWWAVRSEFVGFGDDGHTMPNYANLAGFALSSVAINAFSPRSSTGFNDTVERYTIKIGASTGLNVVREFTVLDHARTILRHSKIHR